MKNADDKDWISTGGHWGFAECCGSMMRIDCYRDTDRVYGKGVFSGCGCGKVKGETTVYEFSEEQRRMMAETGKDIF